MEGKGKTTCPVLVAVSLAVITAAGAILRLARLDSVPPGLHFDEAVCGLMALDIRRGHFPIFFPAYNGREPMFMYLIAAVFRFVGIGALGIRLTSALIAIATVPLAFLLFRELFSSRMGLIAAALTALSYYHLTLSRNGYRNILMPPLESLALYCLWRGYRDGRKRLMILGGMFSGGVLYTYTAARFFPVTLGAFAFYAFIVDRNRFVSRMGGILLAALAAVLVFAPLGSYFLSHPHDFWERANQVLVFRRADRGEVLRLIASNTAQTLGGFFVRGDPGWRYNLPGRPIFLPVLGFFFVLGVLIAFWNWRRLEYALLPIWLMGMSLPAVLTDGLMPQGQRMIGIIPGVFGLAALGIEALLSAVVGRLSTKLRLLPYVALVTLLAFEGVATATTYFGNWAGQRRVFYTYHTDYCLLARRAEEEVEAGRTVVIQSRHYKHPSAVFTNFGTLQAVWVVGGNTLVIPNRASKDVLYLWPAVDNPLDKAITKVLERIAEPVGGIADPQGNTAVRVYRLKPQALSQEGESKALASFSDEMDVLDWTLPGSVRRDEALRVLVHWRVLGPVAEARTLTLHLVDENDVLWSQHGHMGYLSEQWRPGDRVYQLFEVQLPPGIPAGRYRARLLLSREGGDLLPVVQGGRMAGIFLSLGDVVLEPDGGFIQPLASDGIGFGQMLTAISHSDLNETAVLGGQVEFTVTWQARAKMGRDLAVSIELLDESGSTSTHHEMPLAYQYPTSQWQPGETVRAAYRLPLGSLSPGAYRLRLTVSGQTGELDLGQVRIEGGERLFAAPPMQHPLMVRLGGQTELLGYDLPAEEYEAGEEMLLRLYWRAVGEATGDHKVFVHLVGDDERIWAQHDSVPANWQRPTSGWEAGEIILDEHRLLIPAQTLPGRYTIFIGMYHSTTLQRLPMQEQSGHLLPDHRLPLAVVTVIP